MIGKKAFVKLCNFVNKIDERCDDTDRGIEKVLNKSFNGVEDTFDSVSMFIWPLEAAQEMLKEVVLDCGESEIGADWFVQEGLPMIAGGGTEIDDVKINSYEDYWDYLVYGKTYEWENFENVF